MEGEGPKEIPVSPVPKKSSPVMRFFLKLPDSGFKTSLVLGQIMREVRQEEKKKLASILEDSQAETPNERLAAGARYTKEALDAFAHDLRTPSFSREYKQALLEASRRNAEDGFEKFRQTGDDRFRIGAEIEVRTAAVLERNLKELDKQTEP